MFALKGRLGLSPEWPDSSLASENQVWQGRREREWQRHSRDRERRQAPVRSRQRGAGPTERAQAIPRVPNVPVSNFSLTLDGGHKGLLENDERPSAPPPSPVSADITAQNGKTVNQNPVLALPAPRKPQARPSSPELVAPTREGSLMSARLNIFRPSRRHSEVGSGGEARFRRIRVGNTKPNPAGTTSPEQSPLVRPSTASLVLTRSADREVQGCQDARASADSCLQLSVYVKNQRSPIPDHDLMTFVDWLSAPPTTLSRLYPALTPPLSRLSIARLRTPPRAALLRTRLVAFASAGSSDARLSAWGCSSPLLRSKPLPSANIPSPPPSVPLLPPRPIPSLSPTRPPSPSINQTVTSTSPTRRPPTKPTSRSSPPAANFSSFSARKSTRPRSAKPAQPQPNKMSAPPPPTMNASLAPPAPRPAPSRNRPSSPSTTLPAAKATSTSAIPATSLSPSSTPPAT